MAEVSRFKMLMGKMKYRTHDEIIERFGGSLNRFQVLAYMMALVMFSTEAFLVYNLAFLTLIPPYQCVDSKGVSAVCTRTQTCEP